MSELIPTQRNPYDFTEQPDWRLENRYQVLAEQEACGERKEQIAREMSHILFELATRSVKEEDVVV